MADTAEKLALAGVHHLKYPVSDLARSLDWWERALDAERQPHWDHHLPDGTLFAYIIQVPGVPYPIELRLAGGSAAALSGFDPLTFAVETHADLQRWAARLDAVGIENSGVLRGLLGWLLAMRDPDGVSIRIYCNETHEWDEANSDIGNPWVRPLPRDALKA